MVSLRRACFTASDTDWVLEGRVMAMMIGRLVGVLGSTASAAREHDLSISTSPCWLGHQMMDTFTGSSVGGLNPRR